MKQFLDRNFLDKLRHHDCWKGTSLTEVLMFCLIVLSTITILLFLWDASTVVFLWLFATTLWLFLLSRRGILTQERFDEVDQRDMDFKDECDKQFEQIKSLAKKINSPS